MNRFQEADIAIITPFRGTPPAAFRRMLSSADLAVELASRRGIRVLHVLVEDGRGHTPAIDLTVQTVVPRRRIIRLARRRGIGGARNIGVSSVAASYVTFLDADDELAAHALVDAFELARPDGLVLSRSLQLFADQRAPRLACPERLFGAWEASPPRLQPWRWLNPFGHGALVPTQLLSRVGGFTEGRYAGEWVGLWSRLISSGQLRLLAATGVVAYRYHRGPSGNYFANPSAHYKAVASELCAWDTRLESGPWERKPISGKDGLPTMFARVTRSGLSVPPWAQADAATWNLAPELDTISMAQVKVVT